MPSELLTDVQIDKLVNDMIEHDPLFEDILQRIAVQAKLANRAAPAVEPKKGDGDVKHNS